MSEGEEKDTERLTEEEENKSETSLQPLESDQAAIEENANVAEDQELKVLPESEEDNQKEIIEASDVAKKSLPRATTTTDKRIKQKQQQQQKEPTITNISKQLEQQAAEIKRIKLMVQSQPGLIKQLQSQLKQLQKQISQIQKYMTKQNKKKK
jgi:hypothetical protein